MDAISLEGMTFFAYHGFYDEEQIIGNNYVVDAWLSTSLKSAAKSDNVNATINYDNIYMLTKFEMQENSRLLENLCDRIANAYLHQFSGSLYRVKVRVTKKNPPLGGKINASYVELTKSGGSILNGIIGLEGVEFFAHHGISEIERMIGHDFIMNIAVTTNLSTASRSDNLYDTLNYGVLYKTAQAEMQKPSQLLETVGHRIAETLSNRFDQIKAIKIVIRKKNPALRGNIPQASVELAFDYRKKCPRCGNVLVCKSNNDCWCNDVKIFSSTRNLLQKKYRGCLCNNCLNHYGG